MNETESRVTTRLRLYAEMSPAISELPDPDEVRGQLLRIADDIDHRAGLYGEFMHGAIPGWLKGMRLGKGWTLKQLAGETGLSISYLSDIERGRTLPTIGTLAKILTAYGLILTFRVVKA